MIKRIVLTTFTVGFLSLLNAQVTSETLDYTTGGQDSFTRNFYPSIITNSENLSTLVSGTPSSPNIRRTYIEFDLSGIPENALIVSAELSLHRYSYSTSPSTVINRISESWDDTTLTWNNAPDVELSDEITTTPSYSNSRHYFDVTDQLQYMVNYQHLNFGWRLRSEVEAVQSYICRSGTCYTTEGTNYRSFNRSTTSERPELEISYVLPIEIALDQIVHADLPTSSNGSISITASEGNGTYTYQWIDGATGNNLSGETASSISGLSPGWYGVEVTDGLGNISYMAFIVGAKCGEIEVKFQPDNRFVDDAYIREDYINHSDDDINFGSVSNLLAERLYNLAIPRDLYTENLFKNRLIIPNNIALNLAEQHYHGVNHNYTNDNQCVLNNITEEWYEDVVTWNISPSYSTTITTISTSTSSDEDIALDLTDLYKDFQDGTTVNYGQSMVLDYSPSTTNRGMNYASSDHGTASERPKLIVKVGKLCFEGYVALKRESDASYTFTKFGVLKFNFENPYQMNNNDLDIKLFEEDRTEITLSSPPTVDYDDNRVDLDLSGLGLTQDDFYYIEVTLPKGGKRYLHFQYKN